MGVPRQPNAANRVEKVQICFRITEETMDELNRLAWEKGKKKVEVFEEAIHYLTRLERQRAVIAKQSPMPVRWDKC